MRNEPNPCTDMVPARRDAPTLQNEPNSHYWQPPSCETNPILVPLASCRPPQPPIHYSPQAITRNEPNYRRWQAQSCETNPIQAPPPVLRVFPRPKNAKRTQFTPRRIQEPTPIHPPAPSFPPSPLYFLLSTFYSLAGNSPRHPIPARPTTQTNETNPISALPP